MWVFDSMLGKELIVTSSGSSSVGCSGRRWTFLLC